MKTVQESELLRTIEALVARKDISGNYRHGIACDVGDAYIVGVVIQREPEEPLEQRLHGSFMPRKHLVDEHGMESIYAEKEGNPTVLDVDTPGEISRPEWSIREFAVHTMGDKLVPRYPFGSKIPEYARAGLWFLADPNWYSHMLLPALVTNDYKVRCGNHILRLNGVRVGVFPSMLEAARVGEDYLDGEVAVTTANLPVLRNLVDEMFRRDLSMLADPMEYCVTAIRCPKHPWEPQGTWEEPIPVWSGSVRTAGRVKAAIYTHFGYMLHRSPEHTFRTWTYYKTNSKQIKFNLYE